MIFQIGIGIAISISDEDRDRDRDLNFGDRGHALRMTLLFLLLLTNFYQFFKESDYFENPVENSLFV